ncbi:MAG: large conductance mechanosensitive channel protein MscL [Berryella intestinalis]|uniref:large conductance mechanosensitive channel protein MscL n=1 Tax=Berryella intestinalis TaxID=1531429 RepID=UPI002A57FA58|nr:large conductance mechanosensitive channel protein MscL [Berryella intestinalis]MDD7369131.1 large conductance mechanosensitive channel protein MscL [Berryella intestinalis]MDY3129317.1 large conductance mechanosensitive channel protein MscL [Berryella intestinalis]
MKNLLAEFKEFIMRGNVMELAVGIIIGGAFTAIVASLTGDIINPLIVLISGGGTEVSGLTIPVAGTEKGIDFGAFITAIINFLIIALVVFFLVKAVNKAMAIGKKPVEEKAAPTCPFCLEEVKEGATRCPHCAGEFEHPAA